ncbi:MAG: hypothetical protein HUJ26_08260 [Planctomycetaceae bacterium]|nr:hypothetical protein [Planctomycetaceae bacterium]
MGVSLNAFRQRVRRWPALLFLMTAGALLLEDQHRLQPWMIFNLWLFLIISLGKPRRILKLIPILTASLYVYSALSKCNLMFLEQHGLIILGGLLRALHLDPAQLSTAAKNVLISSFPIAEMLIGAGLLFARTRRLSAVMAMIMHALLLLTFSSRGLNHEWSVSLWNVFFLLQAFGLWVLPESFFGVRTAAKVDDRETATSGWILIGMSVVIWGFPLIRFSGHLDQWMGWSLYSPRHKVVRILLRTSPDKIDSEFPPFTKSAYRWVGGETGPLTFLSDRWSLSELHVPLNPEARMEFAVAFSLCERFDCWDQLAIEVETRNLMAPDKRETRRYVGREQFSQLAQEYRLPVRPNARFLISREAKSK